jgi:hypothetical protein
MGEQGDQRRLSHVGRLATHVRAGDQQQAPLVSQAGLVGDEGLAVGELAFDHRVPTALDQQPGFAREERSAVVARVVPYRRNP